MIKLYSYIMYFFALILVCFARIYAGVMLDEHYKRWTSITLLLGQRLMLAGLHLLFVNNEYAYLFIWAHQPLKYQREEDH